MSVAPPRSAAGRSWIWQSALHQNMRGFGPCGTRTGGDGRPGCERKALLEATALLGCPPQPPHSESINLGCRQSTPFIQVGSAPFRAIAIGSCELQNNQKQNGHRRVASGKIAIDRPLQQRKTRTFRRGLCPGGGENREGIAPQARSPRDAVSGVGLLHENDGDLDAHGRSECAHVHQSWV